MNLKVVRALRDIYVPSNPEKLDSRITLVPAGVVHLVPTEYTLADGTFENVGLVRTMNDPDTKRKPRTGKGLLAKEG